MAKEEKQDEKDIETMMAEDYLAIGKYEKAVELFKKISIEVPKEKLEEYAKASLARGDIKNALNAFKIAGTEEEAVKKTFADYALGLLNGNSYIDFERFQEILKAVGVKPSENERIKNRLEELAKKKMRDDVTAKYILDLYKMSGAEIPRKEIIELATKDIKHSNPRCKETGIAVLEELLAENELRELAKYFLDFRKPNENMARRMYEAIYRIKNK